jgi:hypothetical protein
MLDALPRLCPRTTAPTFPAHVSPPLTLRARRAKSSSLKNRRAHFWNVIESPMATHTPHLRRPPFSIWKPLSWWDHLFIRTAARIEHLSTNTTAVRAAKLPVLVFRVLIWGVAPAAELNFDHRPNWTRIIVVAAGAAIATLLFSFGLNFLFAWAAGTLSGPLEGERLYYLNDLHNIGIYTIIAPIYIACASVIIYVYLSSALFLRRFDEWLSLRDMLLLALQLVVFTVIVLGIECVAPIRLLQGDCHQLRKTAAYEGAAV